MSSSQEKPWREDALELVLQGKTYAEIAQTLNLRPEQVRQAINYATYKNYGDWGVMMGVVLDHRGHWGRSKQEDNTPNPGLKKNW